MVMTLKDIPELAERLIYIRRLKDLTQAELADLAGTTQQAIQQAESGKARQPRYLMQLSQALNIPHEWLAMNILPRPKNGSKTGFSERTEEVVSSFFGMPKKDQDLMLELMKSRSKKKK